MNPALSLLLGADVDTTAQTGASLSSAIRDVAAFVTSQPILLWAFLITVAVAVGAVIGRFIGQTVKTALGIVSAIAGIALIVYIAHALGLL